jgi:hypothetical protein
MPFGRMLFRSLFVPFGLACFGSSVLSLFPGVFGAMVAFGSVLAALIWLFIKLGGIIWAAFGRRWRRMALRFFQAALSLPLLVVGLVSGDYVHIAIMYPYYIAVIRAHPGKPVSFPWGDQAVFVTDGLQFRTLIYDPDLPSKRIVGIEQRNPVSELRFVTTHVIGKFFLEQTF